MSSKKIEDAQKEVIEKMNPVIIEMFGSRMDIASGQEKGVQNTFSEHLVESAIGDVPVVCVQMLDVNSTEKAEPVQHSQVVRRNVTKGFDSNLKRLEEVVQKLDKVSDDWLRKPSNEHPGTVLYINISILSIVGHDGMGKTTLLQHVYEDEKIEEFDLKIPPLDTLYALQKRLKFQIMSKKFLLVLGDIWDEEEKQDKSKGENVLASLSCGSLGSKILVTTWMDSTAEFYVSDPKPDYINRLYLNHPARVRQYGIWEKYADLYPESDLVFAVGVIDFTKD
ncbi:hypothetical protein IEQ34_017551 [Dendrobium chrysotoxum]|uniref:NB-ARC domain-containing protein n=1 Tax=Dendrobium chrysotoxum TaxID=161865 RepID=A0AAV7GCE8_DENCH|nr:hypothetical protein IEQ34_017551 [Dendrobium chrysotoxum]